MIDFNIRDYVRDALPDGDYTFLIRKAEMKNSKSGDPIANITLQVVSAFRKGQIIFKTFNIYHPKEVAQKMAREDLSELCAAVDIEDLKNMNQLENLIVGATVAKTEYNGKPSNEVKKFFAPTNKSAGMEALAAETAPFDDDIKF